MITLGAAIDDYLAVLQRENAPAGTIATYGIALSQFREFTGADRDINAVDLLCLRAWLAELYVQKQAVTTARKKIAAVRSLLQHCLTQQWISKNPAKLLFTPKLPKTLPKVPTAEQVSCILDQSEKPELHRAYPKRDRAILELLYGCGLRVSECVGIDVRDLDLEERWLLIRGKGRKERQVPVTSKAAEAIAAYLQLRSPREPSENALFLNQAGGRLSARSIQNLVKFYARMISGDASLHPHSLRHAYATHLLSDGADLRSIQELLGHALLSSTQKYTQMALSDLMVVYDKAHPKA